jgi:hypothetical protein
MRVVCYLSMIQIEFLHQNAFLEAQRELASPVNATIITSHRGCQNMHERKAFEIRSIDYHHESWSIRFEVSGRSFRDVFRTVSIDFGHADEEYINRSALQEEQDALYKRATSPSSNAGSIFTQAGEVSSKLTDLTWSAIHQKAVTPILATENLAAYFEIGCRNCTQRGRALVTTGKFEVDFNVEWNSAGPHTQFIRNGWVQVDITDYYLFMDMFAIAYGNVYIFHPLVSIPFPGLGMIIPGFGKIGLAFEPAIIGHFGVKIPSEVNFGIEVALPNSSIRVDIGQMNGHLSGFAAAQVHTLPFSANNTATGLNVSINVLPRIPLQFKLGVDIDAKGKMPPSGGISASISLFISIPHLLFQVANGCPGEFLTSLEKGMTVRDPGHLIQFYPIFRLGAGFELVFGIRLGHLNPKPIRDPEIFTRISIYRYITTLKVFCYSVDATHAAWSRLTLPPGVSASSTGPLGATLSTTVLQASLPTAVPTK